MARSILITAFQEPNSVYSLREMVHYSFQFYIVRITKNENCRVWVAHAFSPSTQEAEASLSLEFQASLVSKASSRPGKAT